MSPAVAIESLAKTSNPPKPPRIPTL